MDQAPSPNQPPPPAPLEYYSPGGPPERRSVPRATVAMWCAMGFWGVMFCTILLVSLKQQNDQYFLVALPLPFLSTLAIVIGIFARRKEGDDPILHRKATIAIRFGIVQSFLVTLGILMFVAHMHTNRERVHQVQCQSHLNQLGRALYLYATWYKHKHKHEQFPPSLQALLEYDSDLNYPAEAFVCPSSDAQKASAATTRELISQITNGSRHNSYIYVGAGLSLNSPDDCILAYEPLSNHDGDGANVLFKDGHVEWLAPEVFQHMIRELQAGRNPPRSRR